jgi:DNA modification methylase
MKPYYDEDGITIYHGDCREVLPSLSFDYIVADPPYANGTDYDSYQDTAPNLFALIDWLAPMLYRGAAITPGVANVHLWPRPRWMLSWTEPAGIGSGPWGFSCWQPILVYGPDPYLAAGLGRRPDLFQGVGRGASNSDHPVAKPLSVMRWIVDRCSPQGASIVDPFMGSGSTLIAAREVGRQAIGIDISQSYCDIAISRLSQMTLAVS